MKSELANLARWASTINWLNVESLRTANGDRWQLDCLYSNPPFQVERVSVPGDTFVPLHRHPGVDSYELYQSGNGILRVGNKVFIMSEDTLRLPISIRRDVWHGGEVSRGGLTFLSIQHWHVTPLEPLTHNWESEIDWKNQEKIALPL